MLRTDLTGTWDYSYVPLSKQRFSSWTAADLNRYVESPAFLRTVSPGRSWQTAHVPGDNIQDLLRHKLIKDPFYGMNAEKLKWTEECLWVYRRRFVAPKRLEGRADLVFDGLDTFATVFLNRQVIGRTDNMHRPWRFDVGGRLRLGEVNELFVVFHPWQIHVRGKSVKKQWAPFCKERVWMRKAQMETGWDWGPRIVLSGIWRPVRLEVIPAARIAARHFRTLSIAGNRAKVEVEVELDRTAGGPIRLDAVLRHGGTVVKKTTATHGKTAKLQLMVANAKLWWSRDQGKPNLYDLAITASADGKAADQIKAKVGIRTVKLLQEPQGNGCKSFTIVLNGKKVYLAGVNWIPAHSFISSVTPEDYRVRLQRACEGNMNAIRVWGGGIYEDEAFYRACDEMGLLVWQDFMFACGTYPGDDPTFVENVKSEFEYAIRRLRVHPSIALWNGNNECQWIDGMAHWKNPNRKMPDRHIYESVLPKILKRLDGTIPFWPSSPYGGNDENDWRQGPQHSYQVWVGIRIPRRRGENPNYPKTVDQSEIRHYRHYADVVPRLVSEFSAQGLPYAKTLGEYLSPGEMGLTKKTLHFRDKAGKPFFFMKPFLAGITGWGKTYSEVEIKSQFAHARAMEFGIAHYRRHLWQCSGSLIWQLNDCWPGFSWSLLDYDLRPKSAYFAVKRVYAPRLLSLYQAGKACELWAVNTSGKAWQGAVVLTVGTFTGEVLGQAKVSLRAQNDSSVRIVTDVLKRCGFNDYDPKRCFIVAEVVSGPATYPAWLVEDPVRLELPKTKIQSSLKVTGKKGSYHHRVTLRANHFALHAGIVPPDGRCVFEDNFVNIRPGGSADIAFTTPVRYALKDLEIRVYNA